MLQRLTSSIKSSHSASTVPDFHAAMIPVTTLLIIALLWSAVFLQGGYERDRTIEGAARHVDTLSATFEQYVVRTIRNADAITRYVKSEAEISNPATALQKLKESGLLDGELYEGVNILDEHGTLVASTRSNSTLGRDLSERDYFQMHRTSPADTMDVGRPTNSYDLKVPFIPFSRRLNKSDGSFAGIVVARLSPSRLTDFYRRAKLTDMDFITVVGLDGVVRARRIGDVESSGGDYRDSAVLRLNATKPSGTDIGQGVHTRMDRIISYRTLESYPFVVVVGTSMEMVLREYVQRQSTYKWMATLITTACIVFAGLLTLSVSRRNRAVQNLVEREHQLALLATHDTLTQLPNRILLNDHATHQIALANRKKSSVAVLFIDLDNFKYHNDAFGHETGDIILKRVAEELTRIVRGSDITARIGGDEFVIVLGDLAQPERAAARVASEILKALEAPFQIGNKTITTTASIGISVFPKDGSNLQQLLRSADTAVYRAKEDGRARFAFFENEMTEKAEERLYIEEELRNAIRLQQFELHYQPQIDLVTKRPSGVEALLRWNHPQMGLVSPNDFIPIAEESGLILSIGEWVLKEACRQNREWQAKGLRAMPVAVNFSALQFRQLDIVETVAAGLADSGLDPACLELELTETMIAGNPDMISQRLKRLKSLGVSLALDDFGTGYSNLQYLKTLPLDVLKVDRSFVIDTPVQPEATAIAKAIISMGVSLGLRVIAEGVETLEQESFLTAEGCSFGQGYLYSPPLRQAECLAWLLQHEHTADQNRPAIVRKTFSSFSGEEDARLADLLRYRILDTEPEAAFDRITRIAKFSLNVPIALISLVDRDRQWFKSAQGLGIRQTSRDASFCTRAIEQNCAMIIQDATADPRFFEHVLVVGEPHIRFYAGVPLRSRAGHNLGTLCCIDRKPRHLSQDQLMVLQDLAKLVETEMEYRLSRLDATTGPQPQDTRRCA